LPHSALALGELGQGEIALCTHNFTQFSASQIDDCRGSMSTAELARNASFRQEAHRDRDAVCRGLLRQYLAQLLGTPAEHIELIKNENGKPMLADSSSQLYFNYSHSGDHVALAFCRDTAVGVDIEFAKRRTNLMGVARHFFAPAELASLEALPSELQRDRFFRYWTLKEAYLKARGEGIFLGLDKFSFELDAEDARSIGISFSSKDFDNPVGWQFHQLMPVLDYPVAIALCDSARTFNVQLHQ
jgi:4'-phosphopantetheinyl transferase